MQTNEPEILLASSISEEMLNLYPQTPSMPYEASVPSIEGNVIDNGFTCLYQTNHMFSFQWLTIFSHSSYKFNKQVAKSSLSLKHLIVFLVFLHRMRLHSTHHFLSYLEYYFFATKHSLQLWFPATCWNYEVVKISDSKPRLEHQSRISGASK